MVDYGHKMTDQELAKLERKIKRVYGEAKKDLDKTVKDYFKRFERLDEEKKQKVADGKMTEQEYKTWRLNAIGRGKRYEAMRDKVAQRMTDANVVARSYVEDKTPGIYSLNRNFAAYTIEQAGAQVDFTLFDESTVRRLVMEDPETMPYYSPAKALDRGIDLKWGKKQITKEVTSSILQGKGIMKIADDLQDRIVDMNRRSAIRAARTAMTSAENAGRIDTYKAAEGMGIKVRKQWLATLDGRTRHSHAMLDGESVEVDEKFSNGCRFPGDPQGRGEEVYNCRCTLIADLPKYGAQNAQRRARDEATGKNVVVEDMTYKEWVAKKEKKGGVQYDEVAEKLSIPKIVGEHTAIDDAKSTNPTYFDFSFGSTMNCQSCCPAYELRRRGYDVHAIELSSEDAAFGWLVPYDGINLFGQDQDFKPFSMYAPEARGKIEDFLLKAGSGARCEIFVDWADGSGAHVFMAENIDGDVFFIDPQSGRADDYVSKYFDMATGKVAAQRTDKLKFRAGFIGRFAKWD